MKNTIKILKQCKRNLSVAIKMLTELNKPITPDTIIMTGDVLDTGTTFTGQPESITQTEQVEDLSIGDENETNNQTEGGI
jgi:hypoxanthine-guanine phosphoribosyltransferase